MSEGAGPKGSDGDATAVTAANNDIPDLDAHEDLGVRLLKIRHSE